VSKLLALAGFLALALSPSFVDWQQSPELRKEMVVYYAVAIVLVYLGMDGWINGDH
jgi:hypothetical protein